jgi:hypothetical protein
MHGANIPVISAASGRGLSKTEMKKLTLIWLSVISFDSK